MRWATAGWLDHQDPSGLRPKWMTADLHAFAGPGRRHSPFHSHDGSDPPARAGGTATKTVPIHRGRQGLYSDPLRQYCDRHRMKPIIARRKMHRKPRPGAPRDFDKPRYRARKVIKRCIGWFKELRRVCRRYDKLASSFRAMVCLACIARCMRAHFSDRT